MAISYEDSSKRFWVAVRSALDACWYYGGFYFAIYTLTSISLASTDLKDHEGLLRGKASRPHCTILYWSLTYPVPKLEPGSVIEWQQGCVWRGMMGWLRPGDFCIYELG